MAILRDTNPEHWAGISINVITGTQAAANNHAAILAGTSGGAVTFQTPVPSVATKRAYIVYDQHGTWGTTPFTIDRSNGGSLDGVASNKSFTDDYGLVVLMGDGTNWHSRRIGYPPDDENSVIAARVFS